MTGQETQRPDACSWCGHPPHRLVCDRDIRTSVGKVDRTAPCPCARRA